jgi:LppP/LprE lipoprotein
VRKRTLFPIGVGLLCIVSIGGPTAAEARDQQINAAAACAKGGPSVVEIGNQMSATVEASDHTEHFTPFTEPLTIQDGRGTGTVTAMVGVRYPTADAHGQLVFFWHGTHFLGWDTNYESLAIMRLSSPAPGLFQVKFARYAAKDALCCPSLKPVTVNFAWSSNRIFISNGVPPKGPGKAVKVTKLH